MVKKQKLAPSDCFIHSMQNNGKCQAYISVLVERPKKHLNNSSQTSSLEKSIVKTLRNNRNTGAFFSCSIHEATVFFLFLFFVFFLYSVFIAFSLVVWLVFHYVIILWLRRGKDWHNFIKIFSRQLGVDNSPYRKSLTTHRRH